jgi:uncharacterized pyridoxamine 5'-phosphate oxidase family protein
MPTLKEEILALLKNTQPVYLASCEGLQPRVRPVTLIFFREHFFVATGSTDAKTAQMKMNPFFEFCLYLNNTINSGYIRVAGVAEEICNQPLRKEVSDFASFIYNYWEDTTNPDFALFEMRAEEVRYLAPGSQYEEKIPW